MVWWLDVFVYNGPYCHENRRIGLGPIFRTASTGSAGRQRLQRKPEPVDEQSFYLHQRWKVSTIRMKYGSGFLGRRERLPVPRTIERARFWTPRAGGDEARIKIGSPFTRTLRGRPSWHCGGLHRTEGSRLAPGAVTRCSTSIPIIFFFLRTPKSEIRLDCRPTPLNSNYHGWRSSTLYPLFY